MEKIETASRYAFTPLFDAKADRLCRETVGKDGSGNLILSRAAPDTDGVSCAEEYFILTPEEYAALLQKARENKLVSFLAFRRLAREGERVPAVKGKIRSFQTVTIHFSGMRGAYEYEILPKDGKAEVCHYGIRYKRQEEQRVLHQRGECGMEEMLRLMNRCMLLSWDGFDGPHPKGVLDGLMFRLTATVNGDATVSARGSQNFPRHFRDFTDALYEIMSRGERF